MSERNAKIPQMATGQPGNYTPLLNNRVNYLKAYIQSNQIKHSHFSAMQAELYAFNAINLFQGENYVLYKMW